MIIIEWTDHDGKNVTTRFEHEFNAARFEEGLDAEGLPHSRGRLRGAAEDVCAYDWSDNDPDAVAAVDVLRAELSR